MLQRFKSILGALVLALGTLTVAVTGQAVFAPPAAAAQSLDGYVAAHPVGSQVGDGQCIALVKDFLTQVWGQSPGALGNASAYAAGGAGGRFLSANGWTWSTDQNFAQGDILVWSYTNAGGDAGHIALWYNGALYDQNDASPLRVGTSRFFNGSGNRFAGHWRHADNASPFGSFDGLASPTSGAVSVRGWAIDPDNRAQSIQVHVYVGGQAGQPGTAGYALVANQSRPDVASAYPGAGDAHGFSTEVPAPIGATQVCTYGINIGSGGNILLGCKTVVVADPNPFGSYDGVSSPAGNTVQASGWAIDPNDRNHPIPVHVYVGGEAGQAGVSGNAVSANQQRADVADAYPDAGPNHGFSYRFSAPAGSVKVCAYAINVSYGANVLLGCRTVTVLPSHSTALTHTQSAATVTYGRPVRLTTTLTDTTAHAPLASTAVRLQRLAGRTWVDVKSVTTDRTGSASLLLTVASTTVYRWCSPTRTTSSTEYKASASSQFAVKAALAPARTTISGTARAGKTLSARPGTWKPAGVTFAYQWYLNGKAVRAATAHNLTLRPAWVGKRVSVRISGHRTGFVGASSSSAATQKIARS